MCRRPRSAATQLLRRVICWARPFPYSNFYPKPLHKSIQQIASLDTARRENPKTINNSEKGLAYNVSRTGEVYHKVVHLAKPGGPLGPEHLCAVIRRTFALMIFSPRPIGNPKRCDQMSLDTARREKPHSQNEGVVLYRGVERLLRITMHNPISQITFLFVED